MKARHLFIATALAAFAGCSQSDELLAGDNSLQNKQQEEVSYIDFSTYNSRATTTRGGYVGDITDTELKASDKANGFGVFAFSTGKDSYGSQAIKYPNFMYNEHIYWDATFAEANAGSWKYDVLKPWPNDDASSGTENYGALVSFFAYAPYIASVSGSTGIIYMSGNNHAGNPFVTYRLPNDDNFVDLLWGTCPPGKTYNTAIGGVAGTQDMSTSTYGGSPFPVNINLKKQKTGEKISFLFKHALAKIGGGLTGGATTGGLMVQLDIDNNGAITGGSKQGYQIVTIRDIQMECSQQMEGSPLAPVALKNQGKFDLATGKWRDITSFGTPNLKKIITSLASSASLISNSNASIRTELAEPASVTAWSQLPTGVLTTPQNVFATGTDASLLLIPGTIPVINITIDYVVRTQDTKLKDGWSETKQKIKKTVTFTQAVELNKKYNILMHLGLTNIKFDATVENWNEDIDNDGDTDSDDTTPVHLPINVN